MCLKDLIDNLSGCFLQNFLFTTKDEASPLKAIDFGLSDYARPGDTLTSGLYYSNLWGLHDSSRICY